MFIRVERGSSVPISRQILQQIRSQVLIGKLESGERLPSVRQLARQLGVNANTIVRVYERLASERLIEMRHGEGTFVLAKLPRAGLEQQREKLREEFGQLIRQARMLGLSRAQLRKLIDDTFAESIEEHATGVQK